MADPGSAEEEVRIGVRLDADVARVVHRALAVARRAGLSEPAAHQVATAASELARNLIKYAGFGLVTLRAATGEGGRRGVELICEDEGPGIDDPDAAMRDHHSTGGTLGLGLPAVRRMMDEFRLETEVGRGTVIRATKWGTGRG